MRIPFHLPIHEQRFVMAKPLAGSASMSRNVLVGCLAGSLGLSLNLIGLVSQPFAETIRLICAIPAPFYLTIDDEAKTVRDQTGLYPASITPEAIRWVGHEAPPNTKHEHRFNLDRVAGLLFVDNFYDGVFQMSGQAPCRRATQKF
jgi:hypothetical protein